MKLRTSGNFILHYSMQLGYVALYFAILQIVFVMLKANFDFQAASMDTTSSQISLSYISLK